jgi:ABC-type amino acid transport system permease subunit
VVVPTLDSRLALATASTSVLWVVSGLCALALGVALAAGGASRHLWIRGISWLAINITRGIPTSIVVIGAGVIGIQLAPPSGIPRLFPGTSPEFQHVGLLIAVAVALGSAGHLAVIFIASRGTVGRHVVDQAKIMGMSWTRRTGLLFQESARAAMPATGARMVHHLHNTAFAALFPVFELFGLLQERITLTFRVWEYLLLGAAIYVGLSGVIWLCALVLEKWFGGELRKPGAWFSKEQLSAWPWKEKMAGRVD